MNHLTVDEIIEFVSSNNVDAEALQLFSKVNQHIRTCAKCFQLVRAFQTVYDLFVETDAENTFEDYLFHANHHGYQELSEASDKTHCEYKGYL